MNWILTFVLNFVWGKLIGLLKDGFNWLVAKFKRDRAIEGAVEKATGELHDQRDLERVIGATPGEVSNEPGAVVQQDLPPNVGHPEA